MTLLSKSPVLPDMKNSIQRVLLLVSFSCAAVAAETNSSTSAPGKPVNEIPLQIERGMAGIEVMINGQGPFLFGIDSGAQGKARIDSALVEKLGLKSSGQAQGTDGSGRSPQKMEIVKLDSLVAGGIKFADVEALSRNYKMGPRPLKFDGLLGLGLFSDYLVTIDFPAKLLRLEKGELSKANGSEILDYKSEHGIPVVELSVGNNKIDANLDFGNTIGGFILPASLVEKLQFASEPVVVGKARTVSSEVEIKEVKVKDTVRLGSLEFAEPTVTFPAISDVANIGAKVVKDFVLTFDQQHQRVRIERPTIGR